MAGSRMILMFLFMKMVNTIWYMMNCEKGEV